jgi:hypothetical protein
VNRESNQTQRSKPCGQNVRYWHLASFRCAAKFGRYWRHSGHCSALALNGSVAIDPKRTFRSRPSYDAMGWATPSR